MEVSFGTNLSCAVLLSREFYEASLVFPIGDAVLDLMVSAFLLLKYPHGEVLHLIALQSIVVRNDTLAQVCVKNNVFSFMHRYVEVTVFSP